MKPDWKDAPPWATWLAKNQFDRWHWYEKKPHKTIWNTWVADGRILEAVNRTSVQWQESAEQRPEVIA